MSGLRDECERWVSATKFARRLSTHTIEGQVCGGLYVYSGSRRIELLLDCRCYFLIKSLHAYSYPVKFLILMTAQYIQRFMNSRNLFTTGCSLMPDIISRGLVLEGVSSCMAM